MTIPMGSETLLSGGYHRLVTIGLVGNCQLGVHFEEPFSA